VQRQQAEQYIEKFLPVRNQERAVRIDRMEKDKEDRKENRGLGEDRIR
jgi:hypothetical protein